MKEVKEKQKGKRAYEKPEARVIELAAEEVMAVGCKLRKLSNPGFRNPPWGSCVAPRACWFKGS